MRIKMLIALVIGLMITGGIVASQLGGPPFSKNFNGQLNITKICTKPYQYIGNCPCEDQEISVYWHITDYGNTSVKNIKWVKYKANALVGHCETALIGYEIMNYTDKESPHQKIADKSLEKLKGLYDERKILTPRNESFGSGRLRK